MLKAIGHRLAVIFAFSAILFGMFGGANSLVHSRELPSPSHSANISASHPHSHPSSPIHENAWWATECEESRSEKETSDRILPDFIQICWNWSLREQYPSHISGQWPPSANFSSLAVPLFLMWEVFRN